MENGKAIVLGAVLKQKNSFRLRDITEDGILPRQLVNYHLTRLVEQGHIEKTGVYYHLLNTDALVNSLIETAENTRLKRFEETAFILENNVKIVKELSEAIVRYHALNLPDSLAIRTAYLEEIDNTIKSFRQEKKWITSGGTTRKGAARWIYKKNPDHFVARLRTLLGSFTNLTFTTSAERSQNELTALLLSMRDEEEI